MKIYTNSNECSTIVGSNTVFFDFTYNDGSFGYKDENGDFVPFSSGGIDTSDATAYARNIESGYTAYCRGEKITGTLIIPQIKIRRNTPTSLSQARIYLAAANNNNYILFSAGYYYYSNAVIRTKVVDAYNSSLSKSNPQGLPYESSDHIGTCHKGKSYALFTAGSVSNQYVCGYNISNTQMAVPYLGNGRTNLAASYNDNYTLFGGGGQGSVKYNYVDAYNSSLARSNATVLSVPRYSLAATSIGEYIIFGGGCTTSYINSQIVYSYSTSVDVYNSSLTRSNDISLSLARDSIQSTNNNNYALFGGGRTSNGISTTQYDTVDAFDSSLVRSITNLSEAKVNHAASNLKGYYALFGGGITSDGSCSNKVDAFDNNLTRSNPTLLTDAKYGLAADTNVGGYVLFAGGGTGSNNASYYVDGYYLSVS